MTTPPRASAPALRFYGGLWGAFLPLALFGAAVVYVTTAGMITIAAYFGPLVLIIGLVLLLARDRVAACEAMLAGVTDRTVAVMVFAFLGAGVFGRILVTSGVVQSVVWLGQETGAQGTVFVVLAFLVSALVATAVGTSTGTVITCVPILYPAGVALGAVPVLILGAIYSGARFGDNVAPISDTTVASAFTQGAEVGEVVAARLKYALTAGGMAIVLYVVAGSFMTVDPVALSSQLTTVPDDGVIKPLWMLGAPAFTIYLCIRGRPLIQAVWFGIIAAIVIGLLTGVFGWTDLYAVEAPRSVTGAITDGLTGMRDVVFLVVLLMAILGAVRAAGGLDALMGVITRFATTPTRAEFSIFGLVSVMCPLCAFNTPALLFTGPVVRELGERFSLHPVRRANLMDLAGNGVTESLPHINTMLALAGVMITTAEATGVPVLPLVSVGMFAFHPLLLTVVGIVAIASGWGRRDG